MENTVQLALTHDNHVCRGQCVREQVATAVQASNQHTADSTQARKAWKAVEKLRGELGCNDLCELYRLPYVDLQNVFALPIYHALLYGVVASFVDFALRPLPQKNDPGRL